MPETGRRLRNDVGVRLSMRADILRVDVGLLSEGRDGSLSELT